MTPDRDRTQKALNQLVTTVATKQAEQTAPLAGDINQRLERCVELIKAEASQADCRSGFCDHLPHRCESHG